MDEEGNGDDQKQSDRKHSCGHQLVVEVGRTHTVGRNHLVLKGTKHGDEGLEMTIELV